MNEEYDCFLRQRHRQFFRAFFFFLYSLSQLLQYQPFLMPTNGNSKFYAQKYLERIKRADKSKKCQGSSVSWLKPHFILYFPTQIMSGHIVPYSSSKVLQWYQLITFPIVSETEQIHTSFSKKYPKSYPFSHPWIRKKPLRNCFLC